MAFISPKSPRRGLIGSPARIKLEEDDLMDYRYNDSGYDSSFTTPVRPIVWSASGTTGPTYSSRPKFNPSLPKYNQFPFCDGNGSPSTASETSNDTEMDEDEDVFMDKPYTKVPPAKKKKDVPLPVNRARSATVPQRTSPPRPALPASFHSEGSLRATKAGSGVLASRLKKHSLRTPDRFIPLRDSMVPSSDMYRVTKSVKKLSLAEKLRRDKTASPDAFVFRRRLVSPMAASLRLHAMSDSSPIRSGVSTTIVPLPLTSSTNVQPRRRQVRQRVRIYHYEFPDALQEEEAVEECAVDFPSNLHQVSYGSAWTVGGVAPIAPSSPSGTAVNDGRGHLVHAGTNAPMFRTDYSTVKLKAAEELDKHRDRLATALNFDQAARTLDFNVNAKSITRQQQPGKSALKTRKTFWDGVQWQNEGPSPKSPNVSERDIPESPFKVLEAADLKDDFYCSLLAYSSSCCMLAVGLGNLLYVWSEQKGGTSEPKGATHLLSDPGISERV